MFRGEGKGRVGEVVVILVVCFIAIVVCRRRYSRLFMCILGTGGDLFCRGL